MKKETSPLRLTIALAVALALLVTVLVLSWTAATASLTGFAQCSQILQAHGTTVAQIVTGQACTW